MSNNNEEPNSMENFLKEMEELAKEKENQEKYQHDGIIAIDIFHNDAKVEMTNNAIAANKSTEIKEDTNEV